MSSKLTLTFSSYIPKPSSYPTNKNCIIISTHYAENRTTPGIYKYNLISNESQIIYKYNDTLEPDLHGQFIDTANNTLILYGGKHFLGMGGIFKIFDLNTNQMKQINDKNILSKCGYYPKH
eukprot:383460_1